MAEVGILKSKVEHNFDLQKTSDNTTVKALTFGQIDTLMEVVRKARHPTLSLKMKATAGGEALPTCQKAIATMNAVREGSPLFSQQVTSNATQVADLVSQLRKETNQMDIFILIIKIMALVMDSRDQKKSQRKVERESHVAHMASVEGLLKDRGNAELISGIVTGLTAIFAGAAPIVGYTGLGNTLKDKLSSWLSIDKGMEKDAFFKAVSRMLQGVSQSGDNASKIHGSFSQSKQVKSQTMGDLAKVDGDEWTREMENNKDHERKLADFVSQLLNLLHEGVKAALAM